MTADQLYRADRLEEAIAAQTAEVRTHPQDPRRRFFLFELLLFSGDLDRAGKQLDAVQFQEVELDAAVADYRRALRAEEQRRQWQEAGQLPQFFLTPSEQVAARVQAWDLWRQGQRTEACRTLQSLNEACHLRGTLNGKPFDVLRDADDLFGTVLEVVLQEHYYWVPLEQVERVLALPPRYPRDLFWLPAHMTLRDGSTGPVFLPALYPGTHTHGNALVRLGRMTDWIEQDGLAQGRGLRTFLAGDDAAPITEWRELILEI